MLPITTTEPDPSLEGHFLRVFHHCWGAVLGRALRRNLPGNLTPQQLFILGRLSRCPAQPSELARDHSVGMSTMTGVIDGLVARGLVERQHDEHDRRAVRLVLTPSGHALWHEAEAGTHEAVRQMLAPLSDEQRARLAHTLDDLEGLLRPEEAAAAGMASGSRH